MQKLKNIAKNLNCKVGKKYPVINVERISDDQYLVNGYTIYMHMDGNWTSNPPIKDVVLKTRFQAVLRKMKRCNSSTLCSPVDEFDMLEKCSICKRIS